jgi:hypothetical protein
MNIQSKISKMEMNMLQKVYKKVFPFQRMPSNADHMKLSIINAIDTAADSSARNKIQELVQNEIDYMDAYNAAYEDGVAGRKLKVSADASEAYIEGANDGHAEGTSARVKTDSTGGSSDRIVIDAPASSCVLM